MYECLLVVEGHVGILGIGERIGIGDLDVDEVVVLSVVFGEAREDALGTVGVLATEAVELILAGWVLVAEAIVFTSLVHVHALVEAHDARNLVLELVALVHGDVALVAKVGAVVFAVLGCLVAAGYAVLDLSHLLSLLWAYVFEVNLVVDADLGLHSVG